METTVLVLNGMALPEPLPENYSVQVEIQSTLVKMISGRIVKEVRGETTVITYAYDYLNDAQWNQLKEILRSKDPVTVNYKQQGVDDMATESMWIESYTRPKYQWSASGTPSSIWTGFSVVLRGVVPA